MTHLWTNPATVVLGWVQPSFTGTPVAGDYFDLTVGSINNVGLTQINATTISLPSGVYHIRAAVGGDRAAVTDVLSFQFEIGGVLSGNIGGWDSSTSRQMTAEYCECVFELSATTNIKLKCDSSSGSLTIDPDFSGCFIKRAH